jgi:hypothetical protein
VFIKVRIIKVVKGNNRTAFNNLSSRGNYLNLLARLKGVNNKGINKRDVCFNVFNAFNSFNILKF